MATRTRRAVRRGARGPGVPRAVRPAPPAADAASIPRWHAIVECVSAAYDHHERRLVDVRHETVDRLRALLEERGLVPHRPAAAGPQAALRDGRRLARGWPVWCGVSWERRARHSVRRMSST